MRFLIFLLFAVCLSCKSLGPSSKTKDMVIKSDNINYVVFIDEDKKKVALGGCADEELEELKKIYASFEKITEDNIEEVWNKTKSNKCLNKLENTRYIDKQVYLDGIMDLLNLDITSINTDKIKKLQENLVSLNELHSSSDSLLTLLEEVSKELSKLKINLNELKKFESMLAKGVFKFDGQDSETFLNFIEKTFGVYWVIGGGLKETYVAFNPDKQERDPWGEGEFIWRSESVQDNGEDRIFDRIIQYNPISVIDNGIIYTYNHKKIFAIDVKSGKKIWETVELGKYEILGFDVSKSSIFATTDEKTLYSINRSTGEVSWTFQIPEKHRISTFPKYHNKYVYFSIVLSEDLAHNEEKEYPGYIYQIDSLTGQVKNHKEIKNFYRNPAGTSPKVFNDTIYIKFATSLIGINASTLDVTSEDKMPRANYENLFATAKYPLIYTSGKDFDDYMAAYDILNQKEVWKTGMYSSSAPILQANKVCGERVDPSLGVDKYYAFCLNRYNGNVIWKEDFGYYLSSSTAIPGQFIVSNEDSIYGLDINTGETIWRFDHPSRKNVGAVVVYNTFKIKSDSQ